METLELLIRLLLESPRKTNAAIARLVGCDRRRVRRYRRLLAKSKLSADDLAGCDGQTLYALFNSRTPAKKYAVPDFDALEATHPGRSGRFHWNKYCAEADDSLPLPTLSYSQFMRIRAACALDAAAARLRQLHTDSLVRRSSTAGPNAFVQEVAR